MIAKACLLLLCGRDKIKQAADIERTLEYPGTTRKGGEPLET
jgi:hypothetical protein